MSLVLSAVLIEVLLAEVLPAAFLDILLDVVLAEFAFRLVHAAARLAGGCRAAAGWLPAATELPPPVQRAVYRTVQEGLTNVRKHAPGATAIVEIARDGGMLRTTVTNTAPTRPVLPLPSAHHGLAGLRQRAGLLGGTLEAGATADGGFRLSLVLPAAGESG